ncbi:MAG TPA: rod shape-determining protein [Candidatus Anoxymicrobiaceae bacterium]
MDHDDAHCNDLPKTVTVSGNYVRRAIEEPVNRIVEMVKENLPRPQLTSDISNREIVLVGGGSLLRGLEDKLRDEPGFPVRVAEVPTRCVAVGLGKILEGGLSTIRSAR